VATGETLLEVVVVPRASRNEVRVAEDGTVRVWVTRPPADGEANRAVLELLAEALDRPPSALELIGGGRGRRKRVRVDGLSTAEAHGRLSGRS
jgi:uncharacterized protein (TIGR00251 family)